MEQVDENFKILGEIKDRWMRYKDDGVYCVECLHEAIRHWDRNMDPACNSDDEENHGYDGDILAHSAKDIWRLINLIELQQNATK